MIVTYTFDVFSTLDGFAAYGEHQWMASGGNLWCLP